MTEHHGLQRSVSVNNRSGLNMLVAQHVVQTAQRFCSSLTIRRNDIVADAKSILSILILGAVQGVVLDLHANGPDAEEAITEIARVITADFDDLEQWSTPRPSNA